MEQSYDEQNEWKSEGKNPILNDKMKSPGEIDFLRFCRGFLSMIEMKREKPSEVEGSSLKRLKLFMNAFSM